MQTRRHFYQGISKATPHLNRYSCMRTYIPATSDSAAAISSSALPPTSSPLPHLHLPGFCTLCRARSDFRCLALLERPPPSAKRAESCALSAKLCSLAPGGGRSNKAKHGQSDPTRQSEAGRARPAERGRLGKCKTCTAPTNSCTGTLLSNSCKACSGPLGGLENRNSFYCPNISGLWRAMKVGKMMCCKER